MKNRTNETRGLAAYRAAYRIYEFPILKRSKLARITAVQLRLSPTLSSITKFCKRLRSKICDTKRAYRDENGYEIESFVSSFAFISFCISPPLERTTFLLVSIVSIPEFLIKPRVAGWWWLLTLALLVMSSALCEFSRRSRLLSAIIKGLGAAGFN